MIRRAILALTAVLLPVALAWFPSGPQRQHVMAARLASRPRAVASDAGGDESADAPEAEPEFDLYEPAGAEEAAAEPEAAEAEAAAGPEAAAGSEGAEGEGDGAAAAEGAEEASAEPEEPPPDPNAEIKAEIAALEEQCRQKRIKLNDLNDQLDGAGEKGYRRLVAEVEGYRRSSAERAEGYKTDGKKKVLGSMIGVLAAFEDASASVGPVETDAERSIADSYQALCDALELKLTQLGLARFDAAAGDALVAGRHEVVEEAEAAGVAPSSVIEQARHGYEFDGAPLRAALVVATPAPAPTPEPEPAADEAAEPEGDAADEGAAPETESEAAASS